MNLWTLPKPFLKFWAVSSSFISGLMSQFLADLQIFYRIKPRSPSLIYQTSSKGTFQQKHSLRPLPCLHNRNRNVVVFSKNLKKVSKTDKGWLLVVFVGAPPKPIKLWLGGVNCTHKREKITYINLFTSMHKMEFWLLVFHQKKALLNQIGVIVFRSFTNL